jgi:SAM-dependent methyltransferase
VDNEIEEVKVLRADGFYVTVVRQWRGRGPFLHDGDPQQRGLEQGRVQWGHSEKRFGRVRGKANPLHELRAPNITHLFGPSGYKAIFINAVFQSKLYQDSMVMIDTLMWWNFVCMLKPRRLPLGRNTTESYFVKLQQKVEHYRKKYQNNPKKVAAKLMWWNFVCMLKPHKMPDVCYFFDNRKNTNEVCACIELQGGIKDVLVGLAWIKEFYKQSPYKMSIDIYGENKSHLMFFTNMFKYINIVSPFDFYNSANKYDFKISIGNSIRLDYLNEQSLPTKSLWLMKIISTIKNFDHKHYIDHAVSNKVVPRIFDERDRWDELGANSGIIFSRYSRTSINLDMSSFTILDKYSLKEHLFVTIHAKTEHDIILPKTSTRTWPAEHWKTFCYEFKKNYPHVLLVQIGANTCATIPGIDISLVGKTSIAEVAVILKHAVLHIDEESGLARLRSQLSGGSVVLCEHGTPEGVAVIPPEYVFQAVNDVISKSVLYHYRCEYMSIYSSIGYRNYQTIMMDDICETCVLKKQPISEHIYGPMRTYVHASKQWEYPYAINLINNKFKNKKLKIADVGGGRGVLAWYLAKKGHDVNVYDIDFRWDDGGDSDLERKFIQFAAESGFNAEFGSVFNIPAEDNFFDVVTSISVVEHINEKYYALKEMFRILKPGGILILTYDLVAKEDIHDSLRVEIFTPLSIANIFNELQIEYDSIYDIADVAASIKDIENDNVSTEANITVGGLVITKNQRCDV